MADGFTVTKRIAKPTSEVWDVLADLDKAPAWMAGIESMVQKTPGPLQVGSRFGFVSRGKERETRVSALSPGETIALTSTQGGVTATYRYSLAAADGDTEATLDARCEARGLWKLLHPIIVFAMRKTDGDQLARLATVVENKTK